MGLTDKPRYIMREDGKGKWGVYDREQGKFVGKLTKDRYAAGAALIQKVEKERAKEK
jgi:hypothetical protein